MRGPTGAAIVSVARLGWVCHGPFEWETDDGRRLHLAQLSPAIVKSISHIISAFHKWESHLKELERRKGTNAKLPEGAKVHALR